MYCNITFIYQYMQSFKFSLVNINNTTSQPGLNGALFVQRSGTKKREWKTEKAAQIKIRTIINQSFK